MKEQYVEDGSTVILGKVGENQATKLLFPVVKKWKELFGNGTFHLIFRRPEDSSSYPVAITADENDVAWVVSSTDVSQEGIGECELSFTVGTAVVKSETYRCKILPSIAPTGATPPAVGSGWINDFLTYREQLEGEIPTALADLTDDATHRTVTDAEKTQWNGKQQCLVYANYEAMAEGLQEAGTDFKVGTNIYIIQENVPDLWIANVQTVSHNYTYTNDQAVIGALTGNASTTLKIGKYRLCKLESVKAAWDATFSNAMKNALMEGQTGSVSLQDYEKESIRNHLGAKAAMTITKKNASVTQDTLVMMRNHEYIYGELTSLNLAFSGKDSVNDPNLDTSISDGDEILLMFKSGEIPTTLTVDSTNAIFASFAPSANSYVVISARWDSAANKWLVTFDEPNKASDAAMKVKVNNTAITPGDDGYANISFGFGLKYNPAMGIGVNGSSYGGIDSRTQRNPNGSLWGAGDTFPIVPSNLDYAVKKAMVDGFGASWTDEERLAALLRMGCTVDANGFVKWTAQ